LDSVPLLPWQMEDLQRQYLRQVRMLTGCHLRQFGPKYPRRIFLQTDS
jgi:hypothetical protein